MVVYGRRRRRWPYLFAGLVVLLAAVAAGAFIVSSSKGKLTTDPDALARVSLPVGGGRIESVSVVTGPHSQPVAVDIRGDRIYPRRRVPVGETLQIQVVVRRPGWISWLSGATQRLQLTVTAPKAQLKSQFVTLGRGAPLRVSFRTPVTAYWFGAAAHGLHRTTLARPASTITLPRGAEAGTVFVAAVPRSWERARAQPVSWFPAGGTGTAVASPAPGSRISADTPITLTFSRPVSRVLGSHLPIVSPASDGSWKTLGSHSIQFRPTGYGYGLGATVKIALPGGVHLVGAGAAGGNWTVPAGSTMRLQQMLAALGYLPVKFSVSGPGAGAALTPQAQEAAAVKPPAGTFSMRYPNTPGWLAGSWQPGAFGEITKGAVMAFENDHGLAPDGDAGPQVWKALMNAVIHNQTSTFGYTVVDVNMNVPESLTLWHSGKTIISGTPVNTGIPQSPTAPGTFAVYEHLRVTTMSGTNPDGSHYSDPGIPFVSYFNGGDALHGFIRGSYGSPQSLGCVEMPFAVAGHVWPYTPIGTIVHVT